MNSASNHEERSGDVSRAGSPLRRGLGRRILLWFLVLSLVPLFVSNAVGYLVTRQIIRDQVERYLQALTELQAQHVATEVERNQLYLLAVTAGHTALADGISEAATGLTASLEDPAVVDLQQQLAGILGQLDPLTELFVVDTGGLVVGATEPYRVGEGWSDSALYRRGRKGRFFAVSQRRARGQVWPTYQLSVPINSDSLEPAGILAAMVGFDKLQHFLRIPPHMAVDVHGYIVDSEGRPILISHPHNHIDYGARFPSPLADRPPGSIARYINYEGIKVLGTSQAISGIDWLYISEVSLASAFGQLRNLAILAGALEGLFALLLVAVVWLVARSIVSPLRSLVNAAERIRKGELGVTVEIGREDELGQLGKTFNQMSSELHTSSERIQQLHEREMRRAAQLASVGELASGIAHEIKNPLVGMSSGIDLLSERLTGDEGARAITDQIRGQIRRLESAVHDLLSYARPKEPRTVWTSPIGLLERAASLVGPKAEAAGVKVEIQAQAGLPKLQVDPELLNQALVNLSLNGIQAMSEGGKLSLSATETGRVVKLQVSDTGPGIPENQIEGILRPFYTTKHRGTGLGLTITRGIVERHGGRLEVQSTPGSGATFTLVIPAEVEPAVDEEGHAE